MRITTLARTILIGLAFALGAVQANAALISSYDFNGNLSDTLGNGPDMVGLGGTVSGGRYSFGPNEGLSLSGGLADTSSFAVEMKFAQTSGNNSWRKLIDFEGLTEDLGFYINPDSFAAFWTGETTGGPDLFSIGTETVIALTRDGATDTVSAFLNGALQWSFLDDQNQAVSSLNLLHFFVDDFATGQSEAFAGSVDYIRIFDGPSTAIIPEPGTLALLGLGLAAMGFRLRRKEPA